LTICQWFGLKTTGSGFLVEPRNQGRRFVSGLASKPQGRVYWFGRKTKVNGLSVGWPQNHWNNFSQFDLKTDGNGFPSVALKIGSYGLMI
jgi:hypothetical protein